jgi:sugar phosphate permease
MTPDQKAKTARILGYICVVVGVLNLAIIGVHALQGQADGTSPLLVTGVVALSMGIFMLALGKRKPTSQG